MRVRCVKNRIEEMQGDTRLYEMLTKVVGYKADHQLKLTVGREYVVYAISVKYGYPWFFVADDTYTSYPMAYAAPMFQVVDSRLSQHWRFGYALFEDSSEEPVNLIAFEEWAVDYSFYERLLDSEPNEKSLFHRYKVMIDLEAEESIEK
jgi:hypothetical protein